MDGTLSSILADDLYARLGTATAPIVLDVRRRDDFSADDSVIVSAARCDVTRERQWLDGLAAAKAVVVYCADGGEISQAAAAALREAGISGAHLEGGIAGWQKRGLPTRRKFDARTNKWVTRERPKIDRIACPWLIQRFIDPRAEFIYVPAGEVLSVAAKTGATPFDIEGVEFAHEGDRCSFDTFLRIYGIEDAPLNSSPPSCAAPTHRDMIWRRNAAGCSRFPSASLRTSPTTMKCWPTAWSYTTRSTLGAVPCSRKPITGRLRRRPQR